MPNTYKQLRRVLARNLTYLASLVALEQWYRQVRRPFFEAQDLGPLVYEGALDALASARAERAKRLTLTLGKVTPDDDSRAQLRERAADLVAVFDTPELPDGAGFHEAFRAFARQSPAGYVGTVQALPPEVSRSGVRWLQEIVDHLCGRAASLVPSSGLFPAA